MEFIVAFYGIVKAGAVATTVNSSYRERELANQLNDSGTTVLVVHQFLFQRAENAMEAIPSLNRLIVIGAIRDDQESFWELVTQAQATLPPVLLDPKQDLAALPYSSGTTGLSKGVMLTHFNLASNVRQFIGRTAEAATIREDDVVLVHLPLSHIYGLNILMNGCIGAGVTQVLMGRFEIEGFLRVISRQRVTILFTVPPVGLELTHYAGIREF